MSRTRSPWVIRTVWQLINLSTPQIPSYNLVLNCWRVTLYECPAAWQAASNGGVVINGVSLERFDLMIFQNVGDQTSMQTQPAIIVRVGGAYDPEGLPIYLNETWTLDMNVGGAISQRSVLVVQEFIDRDARARG